MTRHDQLAEQNEHYPATINPDSEPSEPSAEWGWHGGFPRGSIIAGWSTAAILVIILVTHLRGGHSEGHVADVYLAVIATVMILLLIRHAVRARHPWRR